MKIVSSPSSPFGSSTISPYSMRNKCGSPSSSRITTSRVTPSNDNEYGDFKKRIERLKIRVRSLEAELSEEKTKGRLLQLRQLTGDVGDVRSENQQSIPHTRPAKNGFSGSFWEDIQRDKSFIQNLGFGGTESEAGDATARESPVSTTGGESDITFHFLFSFTRTILEPVAEKSAEVTNLSLRIRIFEYTIRFAGQRYFFDSGGVLSQKPAGS